MMRLFDCFHQSLLKKCNQQFPITESSCVVEALQQTLLLFSKKLTVPAQCAQLAHCLIYAWALPAHPYNA